MRAKISGPAQPNKKEEILNIHKALYIHTAPCGMSYLLLSRLYHSSGSLDMHKQEMEEEEKL